MGWFILFLYILGIPCWIWIEKKYFPFREGDYHIEFDGAHEITPDIWKTEVCARAGLWPLCVLFIIVLSPISVIDKLFDIL